MIDGLLASPAGALVILLVALLAHEPLRWAGLYLGRGLSPDSSVFVWVRCVATALVAGLVTRLVLFPAGVLEEVPATIRLTALATGIAIYLATNRHLGTGVFAAATVFLFLAFLTQ